MKKWLLLIILLFPGAAFASWNPAVPKYATATQWTNGCQADIIADARAAAHAYGSSYSSGAVHGVYRFSNEYCVLFNGSVYRYVVDVQTWYTTNPEDYPSTEYFGKVYTDSECVAEFGTGAVSTGQPYDGSGGHCSVPSPDDWCTDLNNATLRNQRVYEVGSTLPGINEIITFEDDMGPNVCEATVDTDNLWQSPDGTYWALWDYTGAVNSDDPLFDYDADTSEAEPPSDLLTLTNDVQNDCPWSNVTLSGVNYCYNGPDADQGATYADSSTRVDHWDGSYTVTDSAGNSTTYRSDGTPSGTASTLPGGGPAGDESLCPDWWCDGTGLTPTEAPTVPEEAISIQDKEVLYDSGMAETATCPPPEEVTFSLGGQSMSIGFAYDGFCTLAGYLRPLLLAMANLAAAMLIYRGIL